MNKSVPILSAICLGGVFCVGMLALQAGGLAQQPPSSRQPDKAVPALTPVANQEPAANAEPPAEETKPEDDDQLANDTEILASQGATFAAKTRIAVFSGDVRVKDPRFTIACATLTVYLAKGAVPGTSSTPPPVETPAKSGDAKSGESARGNGIDRAIAEGHVIIIQKHPPAKPGEEEKVSIGRADIAEFDNKTGDTTLRGMPRVEQNGNIHQALSRATVMILGSDNSLKTIGPSRTIIVPHGKDNLPGSTPAAKADSSPPAGTRAH